MANSNISSAPSLILVLGDQLCLRHGALANARPGIDSIVMAEVKEEASYVLHNAHKIAFIFSAMRHFRNRLQQAGFNVIYFRYEDGIRSLQSAVTQALQHCEVDRVICSEPGEYRLLAAMKHWHISAPLELVDDDRFLIGPTDFQQWAGNRKQLRMEYFYRHMRKKYGVLLDDAGAPEGGKWNYDAENRRGWRGTEHIPERPPVDIDPCTAEVLEMVRREFPDNPGDLDAFYLASTEEDAQAYFAWFLSHALPRFGTYQDALADASPWLFHSLISAYLNTGLLDPLDICRQTEQAWRNGKCELSAAEGFIRQILGWREYVRGIYWMTAPDYAQRNGLQAHRPLPHWFWTADIDMRCLRQALWQSLELGYAHHIQRLMVIGNFALLAGLEVKDICEWYLAVYVDAFEWVELPNTLGMALHADDGLMASKPYAASGKYIQRQGDHCKQCRYDPGAVTGSTACPYNSLYWRFLDRHQEALALNPRMQLALRNWERKPASERQAIVDWADKLLARLAPNTATPIQ